MEYPFVLGTAHGITALVAIIGERRETNHPRQQPSLRRVLHLAISKRPILATVIDESDPYILFSNASFLMDFIGNMAIEFFLNVGRSATHPGHLDEDEARGIVQAEISFLWENHLVSDVTIDDLEFVVRRDIGDFHHRPVNSLAYDSNEFVRGIFAYVDSRERHDESSF
jgi:hypothetical protein